jgi:hypothetical protein
LTIMGCIGLVNCNCSLPLIITSTNNILFVPHRRVSAECYHTLWTTSFDCCKQARSWRAFKKLSNIDTKRNLYTCQVNGFSVFILSMMIFEDYFRPFRRRIAR